MNVSKYVGLLLLFVMASCSSYEPDMDTVEEVFSVAEIECNTESSGQPLTRTYFDRDKNVYSARWDTGDQIAMCFDDKKDARRFDLLKGENTASAVFYGPAPDEYSEISAVYPFSIFEGRTANSMDIILPSEINYNSQKPLCGAMPMFAKGTAVSLNFYNLMAVMKISVSGNGLLKRIVMRSVDGNGISGRGHIVLDDSKIPNLVMDSKGEGLIVNFGSMLLSLNKEEVYLPIPATLYENGVELDFEFEGRTETRVLRGPLHFERSVMREVKPFEIDVPFDFENYEIKDNEIWYGSNEKQELSDENDLGSSIITHSFSERTHLGLITTESPVAKIGGQVFKKPESVTLIKLPNSVRQISDNSFRQTAIECFEAPRSLKALGVDAFLGCQNLKRIVLNEGFESLGLDVFGDCPNLEYVYIPESVKIIGAYAFRNSTHKLECWDGKCRLIDEDRHALYSNSAYGLISEVPDMLDVVAACNLTEYVIPDQALFTQHYALSNCKKLKRLVIHKDFKGLGLLMFNSLTELETIVCYALTPPVFDSDETFVSNSLREILVPESCVEEYKKAEGWKNFANLIIPM